MRVWARIRRLEAEARRRGLADEGCPACRDRVGRVAVVAVQELPNGTVAAAPEPQPCAACGRVPEQLVRVLETVVAPRSG